MLFLFNLVRFHTYTTLVNGSTYIRTAQSVPVHFNEIGEMVGIFLPSSLGLPSSFSKTLFGLVKLDHHCAKNDPL